MINRRQFLMNAGFTATGAIIGADVLANVHNKRTIGLQLYSLREEIPTAGIEAVLKKIAAFSLEEVTDFWSSDCIV